MRRSRAQQYSDLGRHKLMALARAGKIHAYREGPDGDWFFDRRSIDAYFESLNPANLEAASPLEAEQARSILRSVT